ncbi:reverse transcriptase domain-containing protein [Trichonephila inaurata madagascariensis]|uniref:Reverse transcriptase domain-containing protein n=1 Tax=Trichonephila inaurata madagascariensis TaxID=2747483 RepID=A0A8X6X0Q7_9ARAC|nr:reverse transcriptase domain-containing protein [Trichonephila inaurata madagascariensis]
MSEDLSKFKKKHTAVRSSLTKLINRIEGKINNENEPVDQFEAFLEQLNDKESNLSLLNTLIEDRLSVNTITEDMETSEEIKEIMFWKTKLSSKIRRINSDFIQALYVDDFLCGNVSVQAALTTCIESKQILEDASMDLRKMEDKLFRAKSKILLQAAGRLFDPVGFIGPYTIRIKRLIQEIWCLGLGWDDKLPKQLEVSWNKWCNEIHYLSEINILRYNFQNSLPSNATTIQLHCFSDASKKAHGTVAYLRIVDDGNIISSFVASKGRVAPLKTLSIPRLELMGAFLSARLRDKIATALTLPVSRFYWTDSSITYYWIKEDSY